MRLTSAESNRESNQQERESRLMQHNKAEVSETRDRSKSPRPKTLPGLVKAAAAEERPGSPQVSLGVPDISKFWREIRESAKSSSQMHQKCL